MLKYVIPLLLFVTLPALADGGHAMPGHAMDAMHSRSPAGQPGDPARVSRTIEILMDDTMRFTPDQISVKAGETVRFFVRNVGKIPHEMVIGSLEELQAHAAAMRDMPGMQHSEPNTITLQPGQRGGLVWQFGQADTVDFACLIPGHMEAGMRGKVTVAP
ncbi:MAG: hypothetical protein CVV05_09325 [Gammaproteobacteria bacterium HGW-Gammaproteobacteria-1]|nr:MAG: hypothetical protein CVV05_09325 [Gammaproteobacteria bacterium HGW-Gammaproteobacteria-1]